MRVATMSLLVVAMVSGSVGVFADTTQTPQKTTLQNRPVRTQAVKEEGPTSFLKGLKERVKSGDHSERVLALFEQYAPDLYDQEVVLKAEHDRLHEAFQAIHQQMKDLKEAKKTEVQAYVETIKADIIAMVDAGEITVEEARTMVQAMIAETFGEKPDFTAYKEALEAIKVQQEALRAQRDTLKAPLKEALTNEDTDAIYTILVTLQEIHEAHVSNDQEKLPILEAMLAEVLAF